MFFIVTVGPSDGNATRRRTRTCQPACNKSIFILLCVYDHTLPRYRCHIGYCSSNKPHRLRTTYDYDCNYDVINVGSGIVSLPGQWKCGATHVLAPTRTVHGTMKFPT
uniref:Uncharacterized protein n=1 Tax=Sipha flava TaxID=143950 RepID=A0A2S2Q6A8_9HEMI